MKSGHFAFFHQMVMVLQKKDTDDKTAHSALLDASKHEITVNDV